MISQDLIEHVNATMPFAIQTRRYLHENPEVSANEFNTSEYLKAECRKLGLSIENVSKDAISAGTGFIAIFDTGIPGKILGLRTDIDALPINENTENETRTRLVISHHPNVMHACGHDGHMATLLSAMRILISRRRLKSGKLIFIFEEGEEASTGIHAMIRLLKEKRLMRYTGNICFQA